MLSLFVVNANLAPAASREKQQQVTQAKALAQTRRGSPCGAVGGGFFSFPFFCLACASSIYFYSEVLETDRPAWRGGAGPPSSLVWQPLLTLRDPRAALLTLGRCPISAVSLLGLCPRRGSQSHHSLSLRSQRLILPTAASQG